MKKNKYDTSEKCKKLLMHNIDAKFICYKCGQNEYYEGKEFDKICKSCKSKTSITRNTLFHNLRFGIVEALAIAQEFRNSENTLSSGFVARKYNITQKTSWNYLKKLKENKIFIEGVFNPKSREESTREESTREELTREEVLIIEEKLKKYLLKKGKL